MGKGKSQNPLQRVGFADFAAPHYLGKNGGIANVSHHGIRFLGRIALQMHGGKSAEPEVVGQFGMWILWRGERLSEGQALRER